MAGNPRRLLIDLAVGVGVFLIGCEKEPTATQAGDSRSSLRSPSTSGPGASETAALRSRVTDDGANTAAPTGHPAGPAGSSGADGGVRAAAANDLAFEVPADWKSQPLSSSMRKAQFVLPRAEGDSEDGELVVYYLGPGQGGDVTSNLVRWRGQITNVDGLPLAENAGKEERFNAGGLAVTLLDVSGRYADPMSKTPGAHENYRMFAAVIEASRGPWFVKATGPAATMEQQREAVRKFVASAKP